VLVVSAACYYLAYLILFLCGELSYDFNFLAFLKEKLSAISYHKKEKAVAVGVSLEVYELNMKCMRVLGSET
jgi:hypothetical protein